jgi:hypothetical protein
MAAGVRSFEPGDRAQQGGLARAGRAEDDHELGLADLESTPSSARTAPKAFESPRTESTGALTRASSALGIEQAHDGRIEREAQLVANARARLRPHGDATERRVDVLVAASAGKSVERDAAAHGTVGARTHALGTHAEHSATHRDRVSERHGLSHPRGGIRSSPRRCAPRLRSVHARAADETRDEQRRRIVVHLARRTDLQDRADSITTMRSASRMASSGRA